MTGRLCVIGNSHAACLKLAGDADPAGLPGAAYFAASANLTGRLRLVEGRFLAAEDAELARQFAAVSGGQTRIDLADYDAFALVGICLRPRDLFRLFRGHCLWRHRAWRGDRPLISDAGFRAVLASLHADLPGYRLARAIASARPEAALLLLPAPCPTAAALEDKGLRALRGLRETPYFAELARLHRALAAPAAAAVGARAVFQRPETLDAPGFTAPQFNEKPVGLLQSHKAGEGAWHGEKARPDPWHMNPAFGRTRLEDIAAALAA